MPKFYVRLPIVGIQSQEVEADSAEEAVQKALDHGYDYDLIEELNIIERVFEGEVCHAPLFEAEVEEAWTREED